MINEEVGITDPSAVDAFSNGTDSDTEFNNTIILLYARSPGYAYWLGIILIVILGLVGNTLVIILMSDVKLVTLSYTVYLKFLAISDSIVLFLFGVRETLRLFTSPFLVATNPIACSFSWFTLSTTTMSSPWLVVGLLMDRFFCVVFPLKRHMLCTRKIAIITCSSISVVSLIMSLPLLFGSKVQEGQISCFIESSLLPYFTFLRLIITSNIPCLMILIFNIAIGIHIQRSARFRKKFTSTSSGAAEEKKDNSLRPMLLISMLAFLTIMPSSVTESVIGIIMNSEKHSKKAVSILKWWLLSHIPYLVNFAQNFYILMASSVNYRNIMRNKLKALRESKRTGSARVPVSSVQVSDGVTI